MNRKRIELILVWILGFVISATSFQCGMPYTPGDIFIFFIIDTFVVPIVTMCGVLLYSLGRVKGSTLLSGITLLFVYKEFSKDSLEYAIEYCTRGTLLFSLYAFVFPVLLFSFMLIGIYMEKKKCEKKQKLIN